MKYTLLFSLLIICAFRLPAQDELHCATDRVMKAHYKKHPELEQKQHQEHIARAQRIATGSQQVNAASYTIPIVFHILHLGGPENISDAQVLDGVRILNRDYAKENPDTADIIPSFKPIADSMGIQFALATIDPNGQCTNGIIHHYDTNTDWYDTSSYDYTWDPTRYLNVYIVRTITLGGGFGAAGYTFFPGSFADGDPMDAIVLLNNYFGSIGTGSGFTSRPLTHEVGHWLGLLHVFGGTNGAGIDCMTDDFIFDTPQTAGFLSCPDVNDPSTYQLCTPGVDENFQNYMDYSYCNRMFTQGQGAAMRLTLQSTPGARNNLWTNANLISTGVLNPMSPCAPVADFGSDRTTVCVGAPVTFYDLSTNGTPTSYTWTLSGATPPTSAAASPTVVYNTPGTYPVTYASGNAAGSSAPITKPSYITVTSATAMYQGLFNEGFETGTFANEWQEYSSSGGSHWVATSDAALTGNQSARIPYASNTRNMKTSMESPSVNLTLLSPMILSYWYAGQETNPDHVNSLRVYITADCGTSWTLIDSIGGMDLASGGLGPQGYIPADQSEWIERVISLNPFSAASSAYFKFQYTRDTISAANNFYIDDINVTPVIGLKENKDFTGIHLYPNPTSGEITIDLKEKADRIYITDVTGRIIEQQIVNGTQLRMLKNKPEAGIYFVNLVSGTKKTVQKIVVN
jgi:hypothetical protein